jgi:hypothetical protein
MGNPRSMFRRDKQLTREWAKKILTDSSAGVQTLKKEHTRRQRQADRLDARKCVVSEPFDSSEGPDLEVMEGEENGKANTD